MMKNKIIYLTGFMGSGKSTIGPILANTLGWNFIDLDKEIEKTEQSSVTKIFELKGEEHFRQVEKDLLHKISKANNLIVALGGGTLISEKNLNLIKESGFLVYLKSSPEILTKRLYFKRDRPILKLDKEELSENDLLNKIRMLYNQRSKYYEQADYVIDTDTKQLGRIIDMIVRELYKKIKKSNAEGIK